MKRQFKNKMKFLVFYWTYYTQTHTHNMFSLEDPLGDALWGKHIIRSGANTHHKNKAFIVLFKALIQLNELEWSRKTGKHTHTQIITMEMCVCV